MTRFLCCQKFCLSVFVPESAAVYYTVVLCLYKQGKHQGFVLFFIQNVLSAAKVNILEKQCETESGV